LRDVWDLAELATGLAGPDALAGVTRERSLTLRFAANRPTQSTAVDDVTVEVAAVHRGRVGRATTNAVDPDALAACVRRARGAARAAATTGDGSFPGFEPDRDPAAPAEPARPDPATAELAPGPGGAELEAAFAGARAGGVEAHGIWTAGEVRRAWATDAGAGAESATDAFMKVICLAPGGRSGYAAHTARASAELDGRALVEEAAAKATAPGDPAELPPGDYPVVFESHAVGCLLQLLAGAAFDGLAHADGRGALSGRLGTTVAAPTINLADSPSSPLTLTRSFDAEGTPKRALPLIQDGVAHAVAHDIRSGALAGTVSTGHALSPGGDPYGAVPTNLVLAGGGAGGVEELCAPIERGILVTRLWYANVIRPKEPLVTAVTRDGTFLIEDGRVTRPLRDLRLTDNALELLARVQALGREQRLTSDGELYGRRFATGVVCPALRCQAVRFTGAAG
jgi:PmbA protein